MTFRLADSAVVEPSSSYEEMSSPDLPVEREGAAGRASSTKTSGSVKGIATVLSSEDIPWSWSKGPTSPVVEKGDAGGMNLVGDGEEYEEDEENAPLTMRNVNGHSHENLSSSAPVGSTAGGTGAGFSFQSAPDGGSGVGFFELEEEMHSPFVSPRRILRGDGTRGGFFDDWGVEMDEDLEEEVQMERTQEERIAGEMETRVDDDHDRGGKDGDAVGLGIAATPIKDDGTASTFASGSVPIDIVVRPSSSWVGSLGQGSMGARQSSFVP